jgi:NADH-quinone oxidoreductase subunit C
MSVETDIPADALPAASAAAQAARQALGALALDISEAYGEINVMVARDKIVAALTALRDHPDTLYKCFIDITAVDYPARVERFDVVYHLLSPRHNIRIRVKCTTDEMTPVPSAIPAFPAANWFERETYDMFGVFFSGHPDLRRMLTDYGFEGHPLRKDFPMSGFVEVRYDDDQKRVVYEPIRLNQEYRQFDFLSPWEGDTPYRLPGDEKADSQ